MDPYLEARWSDVHSTMVSAIKEALQPALPRDLRARSEERVLLETADDEPERFYRSDVAVVHTEKGGRQPTAMSSAAATVEPVVIDFHDDPLLERWVQIIDTTSGQRVVTAIEVLSPWNKAPGRLNQTYRRKVVDYQRGSVSLVEIDLLRYPPRARLAVRTEDLPIERRTPYLVCVRRAWQPSQWFAYPLALRERLPAVPIPLRRTDAEISLDLQPLIERVYIAGGHDDIDYARPASPPLSTEDAGWAQEILAQARRATS